jgi:hypothetical protein
MTKKELEELFEQDPRKAPDLYQRVHLELLFNIFEQLQIMNGLLVEKLGDNIYTDILGTDIKPKRKKRKK